MTQTINGCPVCASTRGHFRQGFFRRLWVWACEDCRRVSPFAAQIEVPSSISQHIADTEAAESGEGWEG